MDAGWYAEGAWWDTVGEWLPCERRFPDGVRASFDLIKSKNMTPGVWLEPEVMGVHCPLARSFGDDCFFTRHGKRVVDHGRYQLDFRNKKVLEFISSVVDRLIREYGAGYIKLDYNIDAGIGTETDADSFGDGLLAHNRAYLNWLEKMMARYPDVIIEHCSSGGMRLDYGLLSLHSVASMSDQTDFVKTASIAAAAPTAALPEQAAIWSYPLPDADINAAAFNMLNALLTRIHLSGPAAALSEAQRAVVKEGVALYKNIRKNIPLSVPFYPLGLPGFENDWLCVGYKCPESAYLAVWRIQSGDDTRALPVKAKRARLLFPERTDCGFEISEGVLNVHIPRDRAAVLLEVSLLE
jgi:alpha-galactosidase